MLGVRRHSRSAVLAVRGHTRHAVSVRRHPRGTVLAVRHSRGAVLVLRGVAGAGVRVRPASGRRSGRNLLSLRGKTGVSSVRTGLRGPVWTDGAVRSGAGEADRRLRLLAFRGAAVLGRVRRTIGGRGLLVRRNTVRPAGGLTAHRHPGRTLRRHGGMCRDFGGARFPAGVLVEPLRRHPRRNAALRRRVLSCRVRRAFRSGIRLLAEALRWHFRSRSRKTVRGGFGGALRSGLIRRHVIRESLLLRSRRNLGLRGKAIGVPADGLGEAGLLGVAGMLRVLAERGSLLGSAGIGVPRTVRGLRQPLLRVGPSPVLHRKALVRKGIRVLGNARELLVRRQAVGADAADLPSTVHIGQLCCGVVLAAEAVAPRRLGVPVLVLSTARPPLLRAVICLRRARLRPLAALRRTGLRTVLRHRPRLRTAVLRAPRRSLLRLGLRHVRSGVRNPLRRTGSRVRRRPELRTVRRLRSSVLRGSARARRRPRIRPTLLRQRP